MANLSKIKRDQMLAFLEELKSKDNDDNSIRAINEIENQLRSKKYGLVWEEHSEQVDEMLIENIPVLIADEERRLCKDPKLPWNFIIEGDNLQALYLLEKTHKGKVDCIYIDPPYNTGAKDWKYNNDYVDSNDEYRHSKWLSMMRTRLEVSKKLLNPKSSVLIVTIDENEYLHLGCLLEEMFPNANMQMITSVISGKGVSLEGQFSRVEEYIFILTIGEMEVIQQHSNMLNDSEQTDSQEEIEVEYIGLRRRNTTNYRTSRPNQFYPFFVDENDGHIVEIGDAITPEIDKDSIKPPKGCVALWPLDPQGRERIWGLVPDSSRELLKLGCLKVGSWDKENKKGTLKYWASGTVDKLKNGEIIVKERDKYGTIIKAIYANNEIITVRPRKVWNTKTHNASTYGTLLLGSILKEKRFSFPKSLYAVHDTLQFFLSDKKEATVLDFFAGSGTTQHAVNLLNAEDGGNRKCIMVTNNEISENEEKSLTEKGIKKGDKEWEDLGIAKHVTWPRTICSIEGKDINGNPLNGNYLGSNLPMSDGFTSNVKYFKCDWTLRKPEEYLLSNALLLHIKELIELHTAKEIDGIKNIILYSKSDYDNYFNDEDKFEKIENVWVNENILFNSTELKKLKKKKFKYIPREFFSQELKEVGEYV